MAAILFIFALCLPSLLVTETESVKLVIESDKKASESSYKCVDPTAQEAIKKISKESAKIETEEEIKNEIVNFVDDYLESGDLFEKMDDKPKCVTNEMKTDTKELQVRTRAAIKKCVSVAKNEKEKAKYDLERIAQIKQIDNELQVIANKRREQIKKLVSENLGNKCFVKEAKELKTKVISMDKQLDECKAYKIEAY